METKSRAKRRVNIRLHQVVTSTNQHVLYRAGYWYSIPFKVSTVITQYKVVSKCLQSNIAFNPFDLLLSNSTLLPSFQSLQLQHLTPSLYTVPTDLHQHQNSSTQLCNTYSCFLTVFVRADSNQLSPARSSYSCSSSYNPCSLSCGEVDHGVLTESAVQCDEMPTIVGYATCHSIHIMSIE